MPDPGYAEMPGAIIEDSQGTATVPQTEEDAVKPITHDVDTDDMLNPMSE